MMEILHQVTAVMKTVSMKQFVVMEYQREPKNVMMLTQITMIHVQIIVL